MLKSILGPCFEEHLRLSAGKWEFLCSASSPPREWLQPLLEHHLNLFAGCHRLLHLEVLTLCQDTVALQDEVVGQFVGEAFTRDGQRSHEPRALELLHRGMMIRLVGNHLVVWLDTSDVSRSCPIDGRNQASQLFLELLENGSSGSRFSLSWLRIFIRSHQAECMLNQRILARCRACNQVLRQLVRVPNHKVLSVIFHGTRKMIESKLPLLMKAVVNELAGILFRRFDLENKRVCISFRANALFVDCRNNAFAAFQ